MAPSQRFTTAIAVVALLLLGGMAVLILSDRDSATPVQAQEMDSERGINVQGEGQVSIVPDTARVVLGVQIEGDEIEPLREEASQRMDAVMAGLEADGIPSGDIRTVTYDLSVQRDWSRPNQPITGYVLTYLLEVKIANIDETGEIIDNALDNGANNVGNIQFEVEDREAVIRQAREQAMADAHDKAEHLAQLGGVGLGSPIKITESSPSLPPVYFDEPAMERDEVADSEFALAVSPGESIVTVHVYVVYAIN